MERTVQVAGKEIGPGQPVFVIAEIGASHGGRVEEAARLIEEAARCGADAVKLQTIAVDESYVPGEPSYEIFQGLWLTKDELRTLSRTARDAGVILLSTPGDRISLELLLEVGVPLIKISSGLMTNLPLVRWAAASGRPLVISTGMSTLEEVRTTVEAAEAAGGRALMLMHCVSLYPAPAASLNLAAMETLAQAFPCPVGYSDHYDGTAACVAAVARGARLLEKHFTLDRAQAGPDHAFSADPGQLRALIRDVRDVERMVGSAVKAPAEAECSGRAVYRRCLVAKRAIAAGEVLTPEAVGLKRPRAARQGLAPSTWDDVIGRRATRAIAPHESITAEMVEAGACLSPSR